MARKSNVLALLTIVLKTGRGVGYFDPLGETCAYAHKEGLISSDVVPGDRSIVYTVTLLGHAYLADADVARKARNAKARVSAKARNEAMTGLGLVRTRHGWE